MNRRKRTEILVKASAEVVENFAEEILKKYNVIVVEESNNGVVMVKLREKAKSSLFFLGEVLITECKVMINGSLGIGIIKGNEPERAYHLAVVDAAYNANLAETDDWENVLKTTEEIIVQDNKVFSNKVLKTKVNFDTMEV